MLSAEQKDEVVREHKGMVHKAAKSCRLLKSSNSYGYDDAVQDGFIALLRAAETFDPSRGYLFTTYANTVIRRAIREAAIRHGGTITVPKAAFAPSGSARCRQAATKARYSRASLGGIDIEDQYHDNLAATENAIDHETIATAISLLPTRLAKSIILYLKNDGVVRSRADTTRSRTAAYMTWHRAIRCLRDHLEGRRRLGNNAANDQTA